MPPKATLIRDDSLACNHNHLQIDLTMSLPNPCPSLSPSTSPAPSVLVFSLDELAKISPVGEDGEVLIWSPSRHYRTPLTDKITTLFGEKVTITQVEPSYRNAAITAELNKPEWAFMDEIITWLVARNGIRLCAIKLLGRPSPYCSWVSSFQLGFYRDD